MKMGRNSRASSNRWVGFDVSSKKNAGSQRRRFCTATNVNAIDGYFNSVYTGHILALSVARTNLMLKRG